MSHEEQLKLEHATLMAQYRSARDEIDSLLDASRQVVSLTLTVISLVLGVSLFVEAKLPIIFLVVPVFLYGLAWTQLRHILLMRRTSAYVAEVLAPRVRSLLQEISPDGPVDLDHILSWEEGWQSPGRRGGRLLLLPVLGSSYGLPLLAAVLSVGAYYFLVPAVPLEGWVLMGINGLALIYSLYLGWLVEFGGFGQRFPSVEGRT